MASKEGKSGLVGRVRIVWQNVFFLAAFCPITLLVSLTVIALSRFPRTMRLRRKLEGFWAKTAVVAAGVRVVCDFAHLDPRQNYIFLANHQSHLDIPIILSLFPEFRPRFLAKDSLFKIPIFGPGMGNTGHFSVDRENRRQGMKDLERVVQSVRQGESALVFPEGTRNTGAESLLTFQSGAFILLLKSNIPAVPLVLDGTNRVLPKGAKYLRPGTVRVRALPPVDVGQDYTLKDRELLKQVIWRKMQEGFLHLN